MGLLCSGEGEPRLIFHFARFYLQHRLQDARLGRGVSECWISFIPEGFEKKKTYAVLG